MSDKVVTVQDFLIKKDPEKYEKILKGQKKKVKKENMIGDLKKEISNLSKDKSELIKENNGLINKLKEFEIGLIRLKSERIDIENINIEINKKVEEVIKENKALKEQLIKSTTLGGK